MTLITINLYWPSSKFSPNVNYLNRLFAALIVSKYYLHWLSCVRGSRLNLSNSKIKILITVNQFNAQWKHQLLRLLAAFRNPWFTFITELLNNKRTRCDLITSSDNFSKLVIHAFIVKCTKVKIRFVTEFFVIFSHRYFHVNLYEKKSTWKWTVCFENSKICINLSYSLLNFSDWSSLSFILFQIWLMTQHVVVIGMKMERFLFQCWCLHWSQRSLCNTKFNWT